MPSAELHWPAAAAVPTVAVKKVHASSCLSFWAEHPAASPYFHQRKGQLVGLQPAILMGGPWLKLAQWGISEHVIVVKGTMFIKGTSVEHKPQWCMFITFKKKPNVSRHECTSKVPEASEALELHHHVHFSFCTTVSTHWGKATWHQFPRTARKLPWSPVPVQSQTLPCLQRSCFSNSSKWTYTDKMQIHTPALNDCSEGRTMPRLVALAATISNFT